MTLRPANSRKTLWSDAKREGLVLLAEVGHWRIRATGKANECEPVFFDEMECRFCVALGRTKIEQPVVAIRDLLALADLFDGDCVRVKGDGVSGMSVSGSPSRPWYPITCWACFLARQATIWPPDFRR